MSSIQVMEYLNYREFLRDLFQWQKGNDPHFSQKKIQYSLGISSSGFLSNVIMGRKNLNANHAVKMTRILKMNHADARYFEGLVSYTQARTEEEKTEFFNRLTLLRSAQLAHLPVETHSLFSKWYYVAIREVIDLIHWKEDWNLLANSLQPPIRVEEAKEAVETLLKLNLVRWNHEGILETCDSGISTGDEVASKHLIAFQRKTMDLASSALDDVAAEFREISVLTMGLSEDSFWNIKNEIRHFRKRLAKIAMEDKNANRLYQLNFQLFPLSQTLVKEKKDL